MKELKEILSVLNSKHLEKLPVLGENEGINNSLQARLIDGIVNSKYNTDQEAAKDLYGKLYEKHRYELLKSKLKQRALSSLLLHEIKDPEASPRDAMRVHLQRQIVSANLLLLFGKRTIGVKLLNKILSLSSDFLLNDCSIEALFLLRSHYWYSGDTAMHRKISRLLREQIAVLNAEAQAEEIYQSVTIEHAKSTAYEDSPLSKLKRASIDVNRLKKYLSTSYVVRINTIKLQIAYYQLNRQYAKVAKECEKALVFLNMDRAFRYDPLSIYFLLNQCEAFFLNGNPDKMFICIDELRRLIGETTANRFAVERVSFFANIHTLKYDDAEKILDNVDIKKLPLLPHQLIEWQLFRAYIEIIKYATNIATNRTIDSYNLRSIKLPHLTKDKHGSNISILICDVILNILLSEHVKIIKLDKKLDNYIYRHLTDASYNKRPVIFLKMLRILIKENNDKVRIETKVKKLMEELHLNHSHSFVEIMPFEELWKLLMQAIIS